MFVTVINMIIIIIKTGIQNFLPLPSFFLLLFITWEKARKNGKYSNVKWRKDSTFF